MTMTFDTSSNFAPSGTFLYQPAFLATTCVPISNPAFFGTPPLKQIDFEEGGAATLLRDKYKTKPNTFVVQRVDLSSYSQELITTARRFKEVQYDLVLCPLRGTRMPSAHIQTMCEHTTGFYPFDYSDGASGKNDKRVVEDVLTGLSVLSGKCSPRIAVLDTAKGGDGSAHLADLLANRIFREMGGGWECNFHLFHSRDTNPERHTSMYSQQRPGVTFTATLHPVNHLLTEDKDLLLGYKVERTLNESQIHPLTQDGILIVSDDQAVTVYEASKLDMGCFNLLSNEISGKMLADQDAVLVDPNTWMNWQQSDSTSRTTS